MRNFSKIIVSFMVLICFAKSEESLFMNIEDSKKSIFMAKQKKKLKKTNSKNFKVSGIFFIDELNWTAWINDEVYSSIGQKGDFSIDEVSENSVILTTSDGDTIEISVGENSKSRP